MGLRSVKQYQTFLGQETVLMIKPSGVFFGRVGRVYHITFQLGWVGSRDFQAEREVLLQIAALPHPPVRLRVRQQPDLAHGGPGVQDLLRYRLVQGKKTMFKRGQCVLLCVLL